MFNIRSENKKNVNNNNKNYINKNRLNNYNLGNYFELDRITLKFKRLMSILIFTAMTYFIIITLLNSCSYLRKHYSFISLENFFNEKSYVSLILLFLTSSLLFLTLKFKKIRRVCGDKILDSSVFVDGRIYDLIDQGILEGKFIIPQFIIYELHRLSDSKEVLRRIKGRKALEVVSKVQELKKNNIVIDRKNYPTKDVDTKLMKLAKYRGARIVTTDFNLTKVAKINGVDTMNINNVSTYLKRVLFPDEEVRLDLVKKGDKSNQAVGYLEDGTMVVVENASNSIGMNINMIVTTTHPTTAGRIVFGRLKRD
jgi:uncharacterized protein YacL